MQGQAVHISSKLTPVYVRVGLQCHTDGRPLSLGSLRGVPMVASSPVRHEGSSSPQPLEVHAYQPPWKALAEYAMHPNDVDPSAPHFQHLVNQARPPYARACGVLQPLCLCEA
ncbi:hypothetical protein HPB48_001851 [Haemaphysalis longicornis]|uniref:Uncharacterized protein n=1 Tax=Haemaphysalis longicornis TaxID=44386 RepID=A0A9J6FUY2_HAELO|nr:hypothetical protein HPB48_001851 [Haemaphysalis longicornis]